MMMMMMIMTIVNMGKRRQQVQQQQCHDSTMQMRIIPMLQQQQRKRGSIHRCNMRIQKRFIRITSVSIQQQQHQMLLLLFITIPLLIFLLLQLLLLQNCYVTYSFPINNLLPIIIMKQQRNSIHRKLQQQQQRFAHYQFINTFDTTTLTVSTKTTTKSTTQLHSSRRQPPSSQQSPPPERQPPTSQQQQQQQQQWEQYNNYHHLPTLVDGAIVDERFDTTIFPGPIRGIGLRNIQSNNKNNNYNNNINDATMKILSSIQSNTKIASIPAQNVLIVSNYRRETKSYTELIQKYGNNNNNNYNIRSNDNRNNSQQQQQQQQDKKAINYNDFAMWDRDLAILLWKEYLQVIQEKKSTTTITDSTLNRRSPLTGYIEYLCQQDEYTMNENNPYYELYDTEFNVIPFQDIPNIDIYVPPSVAPHTIRHWTMEQRQILLQSSSNKGKALIQIANQQEQIWRMKYSSIRNDPAITDTTTKYIRMSYPQFRWAMEVVHSRAFCGLPITMNNNAGNNNNNGAVSTLVQSALPGIVVPVFAAVVGYIYAISNVYTNEYILMILAIIGVIPLLLQLIPSLFTTVTENVTLPIPQQQQQKYKNVDQSAVLIPIIDSANHDIRTRQDTNIVYNPFQHTFEWYIGPKSIIACNNNAVRVPLRRESKQQTFETSVPTTTITSTNDIYDSNLSPQQDTILYQICISYGKVEKSDNEWLINYGFLPGIDINADIDNFTQYRYFLSQMYLERNP